MTSLQKQIALILLGLALLYWLAKRSARPVAASGTVAGGTTAGGLPGAATGPAGPSAAQVPTPVDVAGGISDGAADFALTNGDMAGGSTWGQNAFDQLWYPASQIPLSNLTAEDYVYAQNFLQNGGGEFSRRDDLGQLGQALLSQASGAAGAEIFNTVAGSVLSIIPIVGQAFSKVTAAQNAQLASGASWMQAMGNGTLGGVLKDSLSQPTAQTRHILANYSDINTATAGPYGDFVDGPEAPLDRRVMLVPEQVNLYPAQHFEPQNPIFSTGTGHKFRLRLRLWTKYDGGYILPWLSWHFNGDTTQHYGCKQTVNARARVLRAVDVLICQAQPFTRENAPYGYWADAPKNAAYAIGKAPRMMGAATLTVDKTVYFYRNPVVGVMLGSIFPPTAEDTRYIGADKRTYSYYGEPMDNPATSIGYVDDLDVNPADAGKLAARNAANAAAAAAAAAALAAYNAQVQAAEQAAAAQDQSATAQRYAGTLPCSVDDGSCAYWAARGGSPADNHPSPTPPPTAVPIPKFPVLLPTVPAPPKVLLNPVAIFGKL